MESVEKDSSGKVLFVTGLALTLVLILLAIFASACATTSKKESAVVTYQAIETGLGAFQDAERAIFASKKVPELTPELHQKISAVLSRAFALQIRVGDALKIWKTGQPVPATVTAYLSETDRVIAELLELMPANTKLQLAKEFVQWAKDIVALFKVVNLEPLPQVAAVAQGGV